MTKTFEQKYTALLNTPEMQAVAADNHCYFRETSIPNVVQEHFNLIILDHVDIADLFASWLTENDKEDMEWEFDTSQYENEDDYDEDEAQCDAIERNLDWAADNFKKTWRSGITYRDWCEATRLELHLFLSNEECKRYFERYAPAAKVEGRS
jgi:hypothetical protein